MLTCYKRVQMLQVTLTQGHRISIGKSGWCVCVCVCVWVGVCLCVWVGVGVCVWVCVTRWGVPLPDWLTDGGEERTGGHLAPRLVRSACHREEQLGVGVCVCWG